MQLNILSQVKMLSEGLSQITFITFAFANEVLLVYKIEFTLDCISNIFLRTVEKRICCMRFLNRLRNWL